MEQRALPSRCAGMTGEKREQLEALLAHIVLVGKGDTGIAYLVRAVLENGLDDLFLAALQAHSAVFPLIVPPHMIEGL